MFSKERGQAVITEPVLFSFLRALNEHFSFSNGSITTVKPFLMSIFSYLCDDRTEEECWCEVESTNLMLEDDWLLL